MAITIIGGSPVTPSSVYSRRHSYHPKYGRAPERGRHEVEPSPDRTLPEPAESFSRSWSSESGLCPVNAAPPQLAPAALQDRAQSLNPQGIDAVPPTINDNQAFDPPVIVVPRNRRR
jgi:hypothetical protein